MIIWENTSWSAASMTTPRCVSCWSWKEPRLWAADHKRLVLNASNIILLYLVSRWTCSQCLQYYPIIFGLQMTWFGLSLCPDGSLFPESEWKLSLKLFGFPKSFCSNPVFGFAKSWSCKASALSPDLTTEQQVHTIDCSLASHKDTKLNRLIDQ